MKLMNFVVVIALSFFLISNNSFAEPSKVKEQSNNNSTVENKEKVQRPILKKSEVEEGSINSDSLRAERIKLRKTKAETEDTTKVKTLKKGTIENKECCSKKKESDADCCKETKNKSNEKCCKESKTKNSRDKKKSCKDTISTVKQK